MSENQEQAAGLKTGFIIIGRMKSTRLPKKIMLKIRDREILAWMFDRLKQSEVLGEIILATSTNEQDDVLVELCEREQVACFRGSEDDVLERLYKAAQEHGLDYIVHITADCPLLAVDFIPDVVKKYQETDADLITTYGLPHGLYIYGIKVSALKDVIDMKDDTETEVWLKYFTDSGKFNVVDMEIPEEFKRADYRLSLDYQEDYDFFKRVYEGLGAETYKKNSKEVLEFLDQHPEIVKINEHCEAEYQKRWDSQNRMVLKEK